MVTFIYGHQNPPLWDYFMEHVSTQRFLHLRRLAWWNDNALTVAFKDCHSDRWSKWLDWYKTKNDDLLRGLDLHRKILPFEIVVESDEPSYEENYDLTVFLGGVLEARGWKPQYYFSGSKSIHCHLYFDFKQLLDLPPELQDKILKRYKTNAGFMKYFIKFLRRKLISGYGILEGKFDEQLISASHLIRSEGSLNKKGFKTYLGSKAKNLPLIIPIVNHENNIVPNFGPLEYSHPDDLTNLVEQFLLNQKTKKRINLNTSLMDFQSVLIKPCVQYLLSDKFAAADEGKKRALFILANQLRQSESEKDVLSLLHAWNDSLDKPFLLTELEFQASRELKFNIGCEYVRGLFRELGADVCKGCQYN